MSAGGVNSAVLLLAAEVSGTATWPSSPPSPRDDPRGRRRQPSPRLASVAHDIYNNVMRNGGEATEEEQVRVSRPWSSSASWPSSWASAPGPEHRVPGRPGVHRGPRTCRRSSTRCTGASSTPPAPCSRSTVVCDVDHPDHLLPAVSGRGSPTARTSRSSAETRRSSIGRFLWASTLVGKPQPPGKRAEMIRSMTGIGEAAVSIARPPDLPVPGGPGPWLAGGGGFSTPGAFTLTVSPVRRKAKAR